MAFIVEDGTNVADANSLTTVAFVDAYFADRGEASWAPATTTAKQQALVKATDYFQGRFASALRGARQFEDQELAFPRTGVVTTDGEEIAESTVPDAIQKAIAEYALVALQNNKIIPDPPRPGSATYVGEAKSKSVTVGPISQSTTYVTRDERRSQALRVGPGMVAAADVPSIPKADMLVEKFLKLSKGVIR